MKDLYDVIVIGSGPAGMAAAVSASDRNASVCLVEREETIGGILKQCIHDGFGLIRFNEKLTGPEYAWRYAQMVAERGIDFLHTSFLTGIESEGALRRLKFVNPERGTFSLLARSIVAATGCRERTGRQIFLHGERPAGIFTAGQAQDLVNLRGYLPGKKCVILGSGDIGLIMARRLTLEGAEVRGVWEIGGRPSGLNRNIAQCLEDFDIPLYLRSTVTEVHGRERVEGVTVCSVDDGMKPIRESAERIDCDCLILSVGLIPENDILSPLGVRIDPLTKGPEVDQLCMTSEAGIFSCGNALHVSDLVDYVSESGHTAGVAAALYAEGKITAAGNSGNRIRRTGLLRYILPQYLSDDSLEDSAPLTLFFRPSVPINKADFIIRSGESEVFRKRLNWLKPSEMQRIETGIDAAAYHKGGLSAELSEVRPEASNG